MFPNGYVVVDCNGIVFTGSAIETTIDGIYNAVLNAISASKPIVCANLATAGGKMSPAYATAGIESASSVWLNVNGYNFNITSKDEVQATSMYESTDLPL